MPQILSAKAGKLSIMDALVIAGVKVVSERLLSNVIGNGSVMSGGLKMAGALAVNKLVGGQVSDYLGTALIIDGAEDLVTSFFGNTQAQGIFGNVNRQVELI